MAYSLRDNTSGQRRPRQFQLQSLLPRRFNWALVIQLTIVVCVSVALGGYVLFAQTLETKWMALTFMAVLAPFAIMVLGEVRRLLLAVIVIDIPFPLDSYISLREGAIGGAVEGYVVSLSTMALAALYILWFAELMANRPKKAQPKDEISVWVTLLPLSFYLLISIISIGVATDIQWSFFKIFLLFQEFLLYIYIVSTVRSREDILFIMTFIMIGLALQALVMIGLVGIGRSIKTGVMEARIDPGPRVGGTIGGPNTASSYLGLVLAPCISLIVAQVSNKIKILAMVAAGLGSIGMLLTLSRGGWIAMILSVGLLCFFLWYRGWMTLKVPIGIGFAGLLLVIAFSELLIARLFGDDDGSASARGPLMMIAFRMIEAHPILGVGSNNFAEVMMNYAVSNTTKIWIYIVHNKYLLEWAEVGTAGFICFIWFLWSTLYSGWQTWLYQNRLLSVLGLGLTLGIFGHMVHMNFDVFQGRPLVQMLWLSSALIVALRKLAHREANNIPALRNA